MTTTEQTETPAKAVIRRVNAYANEAIVRRIAEEGVIGNRLTAETVTGFASSTPFLAITEYDEEEQVVGTATINVQFTEETGFHLVLVTVAEDTDPEGDVLSYRSQYDADTLPEAVRILRAIIDTLVSGVRPTL